MDNALPTPMTRLSPAARRRCAASPNAVRLRDLPLAEQGRFVMAIQRTRTAAPGESRDRDQAA